MPAGKLYDQWTPSLSRPGCGREISVWRGMPLARQTRRSAGAFATNLRPLLLVFAVLYALPVGAQELPPARGDRLRVSAPSLFDRRAIIGQLLERDDAFLLLRPSNGPSVRVPLSSIERLERSRGSHRGTATLIGGLAGLVASTIAVVASDPGSWDCGGEFCGLGLSFALIAGASTAGAVIGYTTAREQWVALPVSPE